MFCSSCSSTLEDGALICGTCGNAVRDDPVFARPDPGVRNPAPELQFNGPLCAAHPGMPLVGKCPRCGKDVCIRCAPDAATDHFTCTDCYGLTAAHQRAPSDAACALHPESRAAFICSRCGSFCCSDCAATGLGLEGQCIRCAPTIGALASRGSRFAANIIDNFVVLVPVFLAVMLLAIVGSHGGSEAVEALVGLGMLFGMLLGAGAQLAAQFYWEQSIGKRLLSIKVVRSNGAPIGFWRLLLLRNVLIYAIAQFCGLAGLIDSVMIFGEQQRCLHDYLADSMVVQAPRE